MKISQLKSIYFLLLLGIIIGADNCLIDQTVLFATNITHVHHGKDNDAAGHDRLPKHDDEHQDGKLCCKDFLNFYPRKSETKDNKLLIKSLVLNYLPIQEPVNDFLLANNKSYQLETLSSIRLRDKYALYHPLRAPPRT